MTLQRPQKTSIYEEIRSVFDMLDTNSDNIVTITEIENFLFEFDLHEDVKVQKFLREHDEELTFVEFTDLYCDYMNIDLKEEIRFKRKKKIFFF